MAILLDKTTTFLIQGLTGKEGQRVLGWMQANAAPVAAGVTPGKGGETVAGVPVYNSVEEAMASHPEITATSIYVPPQHVLNAAMEAITAKIPLIHIIAEGVPSRDTAQIIESAAAANVRVVGPSSIGIACPGQSVAGSLGGGNLEQFLAPGDSKAILEGGVAVLSKSGGMATTVATMLTSAGIPQSTIVGLGGDRLVGTTFADLLPDLAADSETKALVIIGEIGGAYEEVLAEEMTKQQFAKPVVAFISGLFAETLPQGTAFGHAGAIVSKAIGTRQGKITALSQAGAHIAESPSDIINLLKEALQLN